MSLFSDAKFKRKFSLSGINKFGSEMQGSVCFNIPLLGSKQDKLIMILLHLNSELQLTQMKCG